MTARLSERDSGRVLWSKSYDRALGTNAIFDVEAELTAAITDQLAQVYGVINAAAATQLRHDRPATLFAYDCVQRAFAYRRTFAKKLYPPVRACLEDAVRRDPNYAAAWAMLAFAHLDAARFGLVEPDARAGELRGRPRGGAARGRAGAGQRHARSSRWRRCTSAAATTRRPSGRNGAPSPSIRATRRAWPNSAGG